MKTRKLVLLPTILLALSAPLSACGTSETETPSPTLAAVQNGGAVVIDVRTAEEYAEGHVDSALNIDVQSPDFEEAISKLPQNEAYVVYCRSGNRSAEAIERMENLGFTELTDGGSLDGMEQEGFLVVQ